MQISDRDRKIVLGSAVLGMFLAALDQMIVSVSLPKIVADLGGLNLLAWVVAACNSIIILCCCCSFVIDG